MTPPKSWGIFVGTHLMAAAVGWHYAPREILDEEVRQARFTVDTNHVLSATVLSLRAENSLRVWSYRGEVDVAVERSSWWFFHESEELQVPANVGYYLDLSDLTPDRVKFNEATSTVTVFLPPLKLGEIAFEPEHSRETLNGVLIWSDATAHELRRLNYTTARKAFVKQAQGLTLVQAAQREAKANVQSLFEIPLRIAGLPNVRVVATFGGT